MSKKSKKATAEVSSIVETKSSQILQQENEDAQLNIELKRMNVYERMLHIKEREISIKNAEQKEATALSIEERRMCLDERRVMIDMLNCINYAMNLHMIDNEQTILASEPYRIPIYDENERSILKNKAFDLIKKF